MVETLTANSAFVDLKERQMRETPVSPTKGYFEQKANLSLRGFEEK